MSIHERPLAVIFDHELLAPQMPDAGDWHDKNEENRWNDLGLA